MCCLNGYHRYRVSLLFPKPRFPICELLTFLLISKSVLNIVITNSETVYPFAGSKFRFQVKWFVFLSF